MPEDRNFLLQKHNTVHRALITLLIAPTLPTTYISFNFVQFLNFLKTTPLLEIAISVILLAIPYLVIVLVLYYKCNEYEHLIRHHTSATPSGIFQDPQHVKII